MRFERKLRKESILTICVAALFIMMLSIPSEVPATHKAADQNPTGNLGPRYLPYDIVELDYEDSPYSYNKIEPIEEDYPMDDAGVIMYEVRGEMHYHPVQISQRILHYLDSYIQTGYKEYLNRSLLFSEKLVEIGLEFEDALFLPYTFENMLYGNPEALLRPPWYSGMAQGQALSAFVRLYKVTGDREHLDTAHKLFNSLTITKSDVGPNDPWVACVDDGYYWIEEYPFRDPCHVLNGFIFSIYGLYDYYLLTDSEDCLLLLQSCITTIADNVEEYRNEGNVSAYELRWRVRVPKYHRCHIKQMEMLSRITGDPYFSKFAETLANDHMTD